jgi:hypothetical protein
MKRVLKVTYTSILLAATIFAGCGSSQPDPAALTPAPTADSIQRTLQQSILGSRVTAQISGKTITLSGTVPQSYQATVAKSQVEGLARGYTIVNNLRPG